MRPKVGVYVCHCGANIAATVDVEKVTEISEKLPNVAVARHYQYMCSDPGQELIKRDILEKKLDRIVVASCSPRMHEQTFRTVIKEAGLNPYCFEMANIREHCSWVHPDKEKATEKAKDLVASAVARASILDPLERREVDVVPRALVIGGGVAGIYAALGVADKGFKVYLVERMPSIGGHMAQLDKTFPTLDCSACILTPKMVDVARHPNIELITYAEVLGVSGHIGDFKVKILKKPRYVDEEKCTGCGDCADVCRLRKRFPNEFDMELGKRSAIYVPFLQAVPLKYTIDPEHCLMITRGKCGEYPPCVEICKAKAIDFEQKEEEIEVNVGAIIVATGYETFDPSTKPEYGYGTYENVITGLEFERLSCASGPTGGKIIIDGEVPREIVFISCVGSRDREGNKYCSRVCCMYTAKHAHLIRENIPDADVTVLYTDMRAFGDGFEEFYNRVKDEGVVYKRRELDDEMEVRSEGRLIVRSGNDKMRADLVILATGMVPTNDIYSLLKVSQSEDGFLLESHPKLRPLNTTIDGIFLAGCCQGPKDIPDSVAQANGTAIRAAILLGGRVEIESITARIDDELCARCRTCEGVCPYGALEFDAEKNIIIVDDIMCKGCGACGSTCPSGAITMNHFKDEQITAQIEAMIG